MEQQFGLKPVSRVYGKFTQLNSTEVKQTNEHQLAIGAFEVIDT